MPRSLSAPLKFIFPALLLSVLAVQCVYFAWNNGQTSDEPFYYTTGYAGIRYADYRSRTAHPPLMPQLGALPLLWIQPRFPIQNPVYLPNSNEIDVSKTGLKFLYLMGNDPYQILFLSRIPIILVTLLLAFFVFKWSKELFGWGGGLLSLTLIAFCPNMIAHGSLFTTDLGIAAFFFIALYFTNRFFITLRIPDVLLAGFFTGLTLLSKMSGLLVLPTLLFLFILQPFHGKQESDACHLSKNAETGLLLLAGILFVLSLGQKSILCFLVPVTSSALILFLLKKNLSRWLLIALSAAGFMVSFVSILLIAKKGMGLLALVFTGWNVFIFVLLMGLILRAGPKPLFFAQCFALLCVVASWVLIFSYRDFPSTLLRLKPFQHYLESLHIGVPNTQMNHQMCVSGSFITCDWKYFLGLLLIKTPWTTLFCFGMGMFLFLKEKGYSWKVKLMLLWPPLFFLAVSSLASHVKIGLRHILPIYPFIFVIAGYVGKWVASLKSIFLQKATAGVGVFILIHFVHQSLSNLPHHLSYFNEGVKEVEDGARLTTDSNLNWGQDNKHLALWASEHQVSRIKIASKFINPEAYTFHHLQWEAMGEEDWLQPQPGYYALDIDAMIAQRNFPLSQFKEMKSIAKAGKTFYIFHIV